MVEPMCYYCTKRSTLTCDRCGRKVCSRHTDGRDELCFRCGT